jgi:hypothetical protein
MNHLPRLASQSQISQVARITDVSQWCLTPHRLLNTKELGTALLGTLLLSSLQETREKIVFLSLLSNHLFTLYFCAEYSSSFGSKEVRKRPREVENGPVR